MNRSFRSYMVQSILGRAKCLRRHCATPSCQAARLSLAKHHDQSGLIHQLSDGNDSSNSLEKESLVRDASGDVVLLPKQIWYAVKENLCEIGWLFDDGSSIGTGNCSFGG
ncbi:unnamed protein product [Linum tenue]|uniref:Uncharacterized protein n=1 Tax=Linum tenue TaxID=586396 RepID=A0AAV0KSB0_9ROSI|nr:unnamed protein product [Linum tenue]